MGRVYKSADEQEAKFQEAYTHWTLYKDKKSYDEIWLRVYAACEAMAKTRLHVSLPDDVFHDRLMKAVETVIGYILYEHKNRKRQIVPPTRPGKLITYVAWPVIAAFQGPAAIKEDAEISWDQMTENSDAEPGAVDILGNRIDEDGCYRMIDSQRRQVYAY